MKIIGLFRRFDELGRISIPKEVRRQVFGKDCTEGKVMEILTDGDLIILKKHEEKECKPKTNADRIRNMDNDDLAGFLDEVFNKIDDEFSFPCNSCYKKINCDICFKYWLDSEVK